jgi:ligand-binding sensor domain-containing protein
MSRDHFHQSTNVGSAIVARSWAAAATAQYLPAALFLLAALPACAQQLSTRHYNVSDGLADNRVSAILKDRKGYIWFGAWEGLSRFDGYRFTNYGERDGLGHIIINDIARIVRGGLDRDNEWADQIS